MKIYIGADHRGFKDKQLISDYLKSLNHEIIDEGDDHVDAQDDFPLYASKVVDLVLKDKDSKGVLICGSGQGMCMAANRFKGIRASICWDEDEARSSRRDDDANILCLSADKLVWTQIQGIIEVWLNTSFAGEPRFVRRIKELDSLG